MCFCLCTSSLLSVWNSDGFFFFIFSINLQAVFERFDSDRSGKIDANELREALLSLGFAVSPMILDLLVYKYDKSGGKNKAIEYDNFIEYVFSRLECLPFCPFSSIPNEVLPFCFLSMQVLPDC